MMKLLVVDGRHARRQGIVEELGRIASYTPDILVAGTDLGDGTALDLLAHVAKLARRPPIIVVGEGREAQRHLDAGADRFIVLGSTFEVLSDVVVAIARASRRVVPGQSPTSNQ